MKLKSANNKKKKLQGECDLSKIKKLETEAHQVYDIWIWTVYMLWDTMLNLTYAYANLIKIESYFTVSRERFVSKMQAAQTKVKLKNYPISNENQIILWLNICADSLKEKANMKSCT